MACLIPESWAREQEVWYCLRTSTLTPVRVCNADLA
jgi:hypothetical protein